jgi:hypothetical protein
MSADLDWARLESAVARAVERLRAAAAENQTCAPKWRGSRPSSRVRARRRAAARRCRRGRHRTAGPPPLDHLEGEIESLLAG